MKNKTLYKEKVFKYLKLYEHFYPQIPQELKELFNNIRNIIGEQKSSFKKTINLKELGFCDIILNIDVTFNKINKTGPYDKHDILYYSNININDLLNSDKKEITLPIYIKDVFIIQDKLISVISHEIRHIYDIYNINNDDYETDMKSFINSLYYNILKNNETDEEFNNFLYLVYLTLEHELIARNTMIWDFFKNSFCSKEKLYELFINSSLYESFNLLDNFKYDKLLKNKDILNKVNNFISYFGGDVCDNIEDVEIFFKQWGIFFKDKSDEYKKEGFLVLDDLYNLIKEKYSFKSKDKRINIKEMLLNIHKRYIFSDKYLF